MAANRAGEFYEGRLDHWVTLHPDMLEVFRGRRLGNQDYTTWSHRRGAHDRIDQVFRPEWRGGSGLFAVEIALRHFQACEVVLCGMPLDDAPYCYEMPKGRRSYRGKALESVREKWLTADLSRVRSMSGWTAEMLGRADAGHLDQRAL